MHMQNLSLFTAPLALLVRLVLLGAERGEAVMLNEYPMIMTHDAATGYLRNGPINAWAKTQDVDFKGQLDCGARAFDLRPLLKDETLYMHHGGIEVKVKLIDAVNEVVEWTATNPDELVLLYISHCKGPSNCMEEAIGQVESMNITVFSDPAQMRNLTYSEALLKSKLPGGGHVLGVTDGLVAGEYDPSITCYEKGKCCYKSGGEFLVERFWKYVNETIAKEPDQQGILRMVQAHWQEDAETITSGILHLSSLIKDEERSQLIAKFTEAVSSGYMQHLNLVEVNNVCDGGLELLDALRKRQSV